jgi:amidophosphoribosyltransferase
VLPDAGDLDVPETVEKKEKCGLFGVWGHGGAAAVTHQGLFAQQHRGQESAGIAVRRGDGELVGHAGMGLVSQVFTPRQLKEDLAGRSAIGHVRYSTTGSSEVCNAQPILQRYHVGPVAIAHNGNLVNGRRLRREYEEHGHIFQTATDTEIIVTLLARPSIASKPDPLPHVLRHLQGAYALLFLFPDRMECVRDPWGLRPLSIGQLPDGAYVAASETCAFDAVGAKLVRDVEPGEIVTIDDAGMSSRQFERPADDAAKCVFEYVYFANPASVLWGQNVHLVREKLGRQLARESHVPADIVIPMPDSGRSAALGYAKESGLVFEEGIVPNRFVGRTFILPDQNARDRAVALKLNIIGELIEGQKIVVVDDSIVRGTTTRSKMQALRRAGAKEIHLRISCPPIRHPCFYGIDFASKGELIAADKTEQEIADFLEVDSLHYLTLDGLLDVTGVPYGKACTACWSGEYKVRLDTAEAPDLRQYRMFR